MVDEMDNANKNETEIEHDIEKPTFEQEVKLGQELYKENVWTKIDKFLDNTLDKAVPNIMGNKRKIKSELGLLFTGGYFLGIYAALYYYSLPRFDGLGNIVPISNEITLVVVMGITILTYMIYSDLRYYMKRWIYNID